MVTFKGLSWRFATRGHDSVGFVVELYTTVGADLMQTLVYFCIVYKCLQRLQVHTYIILMSVYSPYPSIDR